jgi:hypothetical protein
VTTIATVREKMKAAIETIDGLRAYDYIQDSINAPCAHVVPLEFDPRSVMGETNSDYPFQIRIYASRAVADQNQKLLDSYREVSGDASITAALQDDTGLDAVVDSVSVTRIGEVGVVEIGGVPYMYLEIDVEVVW